MSKTPTVWPRGVPWSAFKRTDSETRKPRPLFGGKRKHTAIDQARHVASGDVLNPEFDEGNGDLEEIRSSLGVSDKRRPASE